MDEAGGSKLTGIRQIVRLEEVFQKWQPVTLGSKESDDHSHANRGGISSIINKRLTNVLYCDLDEDSCHSPEPPHDVPKGHLAVYDGPEHRRFIIPTSYLRHSLFKVLLEKAAQEFGFDQSGGLTIPCEIETFKYLLNCMENNQKEHHDDNSLICSGKMVSLFKSLVVTCIIFEFIPREYFKRTCFLFWPFRS